MSSATFARPAPAGPSLANRALTMAGRSLRLSRRNPEALITSLMLPVMLMLLFVYLFGGAIATGGKYVTYVVPGVILLCAGFGSSLTAVSVSHDLTGSIIDRFRILKVGGPALLAGHVAASIARNIVSTLLVFGVAFLIGFRPHASATDWLAVAGLLLLFVLAISWFSAAIGLLAKTPEGANGFTFMIMFLPYASSAFVPVDTMPSWIQGFARHQPITPLIETLRGLMLGTPVESNGWIAVTWCAGILIVSIALSTILFQRRTTA